MQPAGWADLATRQDVESLRVEITGELAELRGEMHGLVPKLGAVNVATMMGLSGLVFSVASFAR